MQVVSVEVSQIEIHNGFFGAADLHLMHDGTRHHVARCEFSHRMVLRHEAAHLQVTQVRAFTAQSFREQETGSALHIQRRRVELDELQVADLGAGAKRHCYSVAGSDSWIGGVAIKLAQSSGSEQHR